MKLSTGTVWTLAQPSATTYWTGAFVVNQRELVVGEDSRGALGGAGSYGRRLFVLDMAKLDLLVGRFASK